MSQNTQSKKTNKSHTGHTAVLTRDDGKIYENKPANL